MEEVVQCSEAAKSADWYHIWGSVLAFAVGRSGTQQQLQLGQPWCIAVYVVEHMHYVTE